MYELIMKKLSNNLLLIINETVVWRVVQRGSSDSQFSILERADEDVVLLHGHVFVAVRGDDLVAQKQETVESSDEAVVCACVKKTLKRRRGSQSQRLKYFRHKGRAD